MKNELLKRFQNVVLRGLSMGSRFVLIFVLAKVMEPALLGSFGLMLATISFCVLLVGADYYTYTQRELTARSSQEWSFVIQHQIKAQLLLYLVFVPLLLLIFIFDFIEWQYAIWFFPLLIAEHIAQEINRLLIVMQKQIIASWVFFIRMGAWVFIVIPLIYLQPGLRSLSIIYLAWLIGCMCAILIGISAIKSQLPVWKKAPLNTAWMKQGFKVAALFIVSTLCFKGLFTFDKYAVEYFSNADMLGVYVFYIGIVMGLYNFLDPAIFSFLYPRMLKSFQRGEFDTYKKILKEFIYSTVLISIVIAFIIWYFMPLIIQWIDKPVYGQYLDVLPLLIVTGFVYAMGFIGHYGLYVIKADRLIFLTHTTSLLVFFISLPVIHQENGISKVAIALLISFSWLMTLKTMAYLFLRRRSLLIND